MAEQGEEQGGEENEDIDEEQQISELESLQSIYDKEIKILGTNIEFMIDVAPAGMSLQVSMVASRDPTSIETTPTPTTVSHLPPVTLYVKYTPTYPSSAPPICHLSSRWLNPELANKLIIHMTSLFSDGWPIVFDWIEYIKNELINDYCQLLNSTKDDKQNCGLEDVATPPSPSGGNRLFLRSLSEYNDVTEYDRYQEHLEFIDDTHECQICFESKQGLQFIEKCTQCEGLYCKECMNHYCQVRVVSEGGGGHMTCPNQSCDKAIDSALLKEIMQEKTYNKYCKLVEQIQLDSIPGLVYCPRSCCNSPSISDPSSKLAVCDKCTFPFCKQCRQTWHGVNNCSVFDKLMKDGIAEDNDKGDSFKNGRPSADMEELKNIFWLGMRDDVRQCPRCSLYIQKNGGCNKMTCWKCGCGFCWLCGKEISGYTHFSSCEMFQSVEFDDKQRQDEFIAEIDQINPDLLQRAITSSCPRCKKSHEKNSRVNWVQCKRCQMKFCHLCEEPCYGRYHFNEYGCMEFTSLDEDVKNMK